MDPVTENFQRPSIRKVRKTIDVSFFGVDRCVSTENVQAAVQKSFLKNSVSSGAEEIVEFEKRIQIRQSSSGESAGIAREGGKFGNRFVDVDWEIDRYFPSTDRLEGRSGRKQVEEVLRWSEISSVVEDQIQRSQDQKNEKSHLGIHLNTIEQSGLEDRHLLSLQETSVSSDSTRIGSFEDVQRYVHGIVSDSVAHENAKDSGMYSSEHLVSLPDSFVSAADSDVSNLESLSSSLIIEQRRDVLKDDDGTRIARQRDGITETTDGTLHRLHAADEIEGISEDATAGQIKRVFNKDESEQFIVGKFEGNLNVVGDRLNESVHAESQLYDHDKSPASGYSKTDNLENKSFGRNENKALDREQSSRGDSDEQSLFLDDQTFGDRGVISSKVTDKKFTTSREESGTDTRLLSSVSTEEARLGGEQGDIVVDRPSVASGDVQEQSDTRKIVTLKDAKFLDDGSYSNTEASGALDHDSHLIKTSEDQEAVKSEDISSHVLHDSTVVVGDRALDRSISGGSDGTYSSVFRIGISSKELGLDTESHGFSRDGVKTLETAEDAGENKGFEKLRTDLEGNSVVFPAKSEELPTDLKESGKTSDTKATLLKEGRTVGVFEHDKDKTSIVGKGLDAGGGIGFDLVTDQTTHIPSNEPEGKFLEESLGHVEDEDLSFHQDQNAYEHEGISTTHDQDVSTVSEDRTVADRSIISGKHIEMIPFFPKDRLTKEEEDVKSRTVVRELVDEGTPGSTGVDSSSAKYEGIGKKELFVEGYASDEGKSLDDNPLNESVQGEDNLTLQDVERKDNDANKSSMLEEQKSTNRNNLQLISEGASSTIGAEDASYGRGIISSKTFDVSSVIRDQKVPGGGASSSFTEEASFDFDSKRPGHLSAEQSEIEPFLPDARKQIDSSSDAAELDKIVSGAPSEQHGLGQKHESEQFSKIESSTDDVSIPGESIGDTSALKEYDDALLDDRGVIPGMKINISKQQDVGDEKEPVQKTMSEGKSPEHLKEEPSVKDAVSAAKHDNGDQRFSSKISDERYDLSSNEDGGFVDALKATKHISDISDETSKHRDHSKELGSGDDARTKLGGDSKIEEGLHVAERGDISSLSIDDISDTVKDDSVSHFGQISQKGVNIPSEMLEKPDVTDTAGQGVASEDPYRAVVKSGGADYCGALERGDTSTEIADESSVVSHDDSYTDHSFISSKAVDMPGKLDSSSDHLGDKFQKLSLHEPLSSADTLLLSDKDLVAENVQQAVERKDNDLTPSTGEASSFPLDDDVSSDRGILSGKHFEVPSSLSKASEKAGDLCEKPDKKADFSVSTRDVSFSKESVSEEFLRPEDTPAQLIKIASGEPDKRASVDAGGLEISANDDASLNLVGGFPQSVSFKNDEQGGFFHSGHFDDRLSQTPKKGSEIEGHKTVSERGDWPSVSEDLASFELGHQTPGERGIISEKHIQGPSSKSKIHSEREDSRISFEPIEDSKLREDETKDSSDVVPQFAEEEAVGRSILKDVDGAKQSTSEKSRKDKKKRGKNAKGSNISSGDQKEVHPEAQEEDFQKKVDREGGQIKLGEAISKTEQGDITSRGLGGVPLSSDTVPSTEKSEILSDEPSKRTSVDAGGLEMPAYHDASLNLIGGFREPKDFRSDEQGRFLHSEGIDRLPDTSKKGSEIGDHETATERGDWPSVSDDLSSFELGHQTPGERGVISEKHIQGPSSISKLHSEREGGNIPSELIEDSKLREDEIKENPAAVSQFSEEEGAGRSILEDVDGGKHSTFTKPTKGKKKRGKNVKESGISSGDQKEKHPEAQEEDFQKRVDREGGQIRLGEAILKTEQGDITSRDLKGAPLSSDNISSAEKSDILPDEPGKRTSVDAGGLEMPAYDDSSLDLVGGFREPKDFRSDEQGRFLQSEGLGDRTPDTPKKTSEIGDHKTASERGDLSFLSEDLASVELGHQTPGERGVISGKHIQGPSSISKLHSERESDSVPSELMDGAKLHVDETKDTAPQFSEEEAVGRSVLKDVDGEKLSTSEKSRKDKRKRGKNVKESDISPGDQKEVHPELQEENIQKSADRESMLVQLDEGASKPDQGDTISRDLLRDGPSSSEAIKSVDGRHVSKPTEEGTVAGLDTKQSLATSVVVPAEELEEQKRIQKLDEKRQQQELEEKRQREIEEQKRAQELEEQRRLEEIEEQRRLEEVAEQKRLQELEEKERLRKLKEQERLQKLREQRQASCQPYLDQLELLEQKLISIGKISSLPEKLDDKEQQLEELLLGLRSLETDLETLKEAQKDEWSEIPAGENEKDPLASALLNLENLKQLAKKSSVDLQQLVKDRNQKEEHLSKIQKQVEAVQSWYDKAVAAAFEQPIRTSSSRFVKEQLLDATSVYEELETKVKELKDVGNQIHRLPPEFAETKADSRVERKLEVLNEDISTLKSSLEDKIRRLKEDAERNEERQKEVQVLDANLANIQKKALLMLKSSELPSKEEIEIWQHLQEPSRDLQQILKLHLQEQQELIKTVADQHEVLKTMPKTSQKPPEKVLTYTPLPLSVVTGEPGSSKILEAAIQKKLAELRKFWKDLKKNKNASLDDYINGQNGFDSTVSLSFQLLDSIESQATKTSEIHDLQKQTKSFKLVLQELSELLKDSKEVGQSLKNDLPNSSAEQCVILDQSLEDLNRRLSLLEEEAKLREQLALERKEWQKNLNDQLASIQNLTVDCQQQYLSLADGKIPSETRLTSCKQLNSTCKDGLRRLDALRTEAQLRAIQDPSISASSDMLLLRHQLSDLDNKVAEKKTDLSKVLSFNSQYETLLEQYAEFLETAHEKVKTSKPLVKDLSQLKDQLSSHRDFFKDMVNHQALLEGLCQRIEPHEKEKFHSSHARLNALTRAVLDKANSQEMRMKQVVDQWSEFEPRFDEVTTWLENIEKRMPQRGNEKDSIETLERKISDLQSVQKDLEKGKGSLAQALENGRRVLQFVSCPSLQRQLDDVADSHKKVNRELAEELKSLETLVKQSKQFDSEINLLENWMKSAIKKRDSINQLLASANQSHDNVTRAENLLRELKDEFDDHQNQKTSAVVLGNKILHCRPSDSRVRAQLKEVTDGWSSLGNDIIDLESKIQTAQKTLLPSRQALGELLQYLDTIYRSTAEDNDIRPKSRDDVQQLYKKYKSLRGDLTNLQLNVDYVNNVAEQNGRTGSHADQTLSAEQLGQMNRQYQGLCSDVSSKMIHLEMINDTWKEFENGVKNLIDWLNTESSRISTEERNLSGNSVVTTLAACQEFSDALKLKKDKDLETLNDLGLTLAKSSDWPADADAIDNVLGDLNGRCDLLAKKVNGLKLSAEKLKSCLEDYQQAFDGINSVLGNAGASLNHLEQKGGCDITAVKEQITDLKTLQKNFDGSSGLIDQLKTATAALSSNSDAASSQVFRNNEKLAIERWLAMKKLITDRATALDALSSKWSGYNQRYGKALEWLRSKEAEIDRLLKDGSQEKKEEKLKEKQQELTDFKNKILELEALSKEIIPSLDGGRVVRLVSEQATLTELEKNLQLTVERNLQNLDVAESRREKLTEQCGEVEKFLNEAESTLSKVSASHDSSDRSVVEDRLKSVESLTGRFVEMSPRFQELNHSGYRLSLSPAESSRLKGINDRWNELQSGSKSVEKKLQQQLLLLQSFSDKCDKWNEFLADVERNLLVDSIGDYDLMVDQQQSLEKFLEEVFPRQQILYSIISDGHKMIENNQGDTIDFGRKLQLLEEQWQTVVRQANQKRSIVSRIVALWQAYHKLRDQLSSDVKDVEHFVANHPVSSSSFNSLRHLLDEYENVQSKLEVMEPAVEKLQSYVPLLSSNSDPATMKQIELDVRSLDEETKNLGTSTASAVEQLQNVLGLWDATQLKMESFLLWLKEIKKYLTPDVPTKYDDLVDELKTLEGLQSDKDSRCDELTKDLGQLTQCIAPEDSLVLCQQLRLLTNQQSEVSNQIASRCEIVRDRLNRWEKFDRNVQDLMTEYAHVEEKLNRLDVLSIEDSIATIQNSLHPELESLEILKIKLIRDGKELRQNSKDLRSADVDNKMSLIHDRFAQLKQDLNAKLNKLTVTLGTLQQLERSLKDLRLWLLNMEHLLTGPIVYETSGPGEIQIQLKKQKELQKDIDDHNLPVSSVSSLCDSLASDNVACPTSAESQSLQQAKDKLDSRWKKINSMSAQRKHLIEETGQLWQKFNEDHQSFCSWLRSMEQRLVWPKTRNMKLDLMKNKLKEIQKLQGVIQTNLSELDSLNRLYCRLAHEGRTDSRNTLKKKIDDANHRWDGLLAKANAVVEQLNHIISIKDDFDSNRLALTGWLLCYNDALVELERSEGPPSAKIIKFIKNELDGYSNRIDYISRAAKYLIAKCEPSDAVRVQTDLDDFLRLHSEILRRLKSLEGRRPSDVEDKLSRDRMQRLESELAKRGGKDASDFEAALGRLEKDDVSLGSALYGQPGVGDDDGDYYDTETNARSLLSDELSLLAELAELEKWLREATVVVASERKLPQDVAQYERLLNKHQDLTRQIKKWKPTVVQLRSALSPASRQTLVTEGLCDRISRAVDNYDSLCQQISDWFNRLQLELVRSKEFRLNVEDLTNWIDDIRQDITALDLEEPIGTTTPFSVIEDRKKKLEAIELDLEDAGVELKFLQNIGRYFLQDSVSDSARSDCNQLDKLDDDLVELEASLRYQKSLLNRSTGAIPEGRFSASRHYPRTGASSLLGTSRRRTPMHARLRKPRESTPEGGAKTASGERGSYLGLLKRACRTAIPIQVMMLVLIGVASLVPMCENECILNSLNPILKFADGSPPL